MDMLRAKPEHQAWVEEAEKAAGHPDSNDLAEEKKFTAEMLKKFREKKAGGK